MKIDLNQTFRCRFCLHKTISGHFNGRHLLGRGGLRNPLLLPSPLSFRGRRQHPKPSRTASHLHVIIDVDGEDVLLSVRGLGDGRGEAALSVVELLQGDPVLDRPPRRTQLESVREPFARRYRTPLRRFEGRNHVLELAVAEHGNIHELNHQNLQKKMFWEFLKKKFFFTFQFLVKKKSFVIKGFLLRTKKTENNLFS